MKSRAVKTGCWLLLSLLPLLGLTTAAKARAPGGPGYDVIAPPPPPPPEIRRMPGPPPEIRQTQPPDELRKVAPPPEVSTPSKDPAKTGDQPGLQLGSLGLSSANPKAGERVFVTANLRNKGSRNLSGVRVRFFLNQVQVGEQVVTVPAGGSATASISFAAAQAGAQNLRVQVDPGSGLAPLVLARGLTVTGPAKTDVEDFTTPAKKPKATVAKGAGGDQAPLSPQRIPFDKPLLAKKGTVLPGKEDGPGFPSGSGSPPGSPPGFEDPTGGLGDKKKPKGVPDTTPWGSGGIGKPDLGDGIEGIRDQGDMPKKDLGKDIPDPREGPGQKTTGHGWGKDQYGQPVFKTPGGRGKGNKSGDKDKGSGDKDKGSGDKESKGKWKESKTWGANWDGSSWSKHPDGSKTTYMYGKNPMLPSFIEGVITGSDKNGGTTSVKMDYGGGTWTKWQRAGTFKTPDSDSSPVARDIKVDPRQDPQLILLLTKMVDKLTKGETTLGDPVVSDPVSVRGGKAASGPEGGGASPAKGGELAAAGAVKAVAKWRFAGSKPGSGVTDPAEWQDRKIRDFSMARIKHFEVIDPVEAPGLQSVLSKAQAGAAAGAGAPSVTVTAVGGPVQKLAVQDGKQGWAPLKAGDRIGPGAVVRIDTGVGGEVGMGKNINQILQQSWTQVYSSRSHAVYLLQLNK